MVMVITSMIGGSMLSHFGISADLEWSSEAQMEDTMTMEEREFIERYKTQVDVLRTLQKRVTEAIGRAEEKLERVARGEAMDTVFGPVQRSSTGKERG